MDIRVARPDEFDKIWAYYQKNIAQTIDTEYDIGWREEVYPEREQIKNSLEEGTLYIAVSDVDEGEILSAMIVDDHYVEGYRQLKWPNDFAESDISIIHAMSVNPDHFSEGIGQRMVKEALEIARERGKKAVRLDVVSGHEPSTRVYVKVGFKYVGTLKLHYEDTGLADFDLYEYVL